MEIKQHNVKVSWKFLKAPIDFEENEWSKLWFRKLFAIISPHYFTIHCCIDHNHNVLLIDININTTFKERDHVILLMTITINRIPASKTRNEIKLKKKSIYRVEQMARPRLSPLKIYFEIRNTRTYGLINRQQRYSRNRNIYSEAAFCSKYSIQSVSSNIYIEMFARGGMQTRKYCCWMRCTWWRRRR